MKQLLCLLMSLLTASCGNSTSSAYEPPILPSLLTGQGEHAREQEEVWEQLIVGLERDGFTLTIDSTTVEPLVFERYDQELAVVESLVLQPFSIRTLRAKAKVPLAGTALYPRFSIKDVRFAHNLLTDSLVERIESIIYSADPINEKIYDQVRKLGPDRLLYLSTEAKVFSATVDSYTDSIAHFSIKAR